MPNPEWFDKLTDPDITRQERNEIEARVDDTVGYNSMINRDFQPEAT